MAIQVTINDITGATPYDIYICQGDGTGCFYMATIPTVPYVFDIPSPYDSSTQYMLKVIDNNGCVITGIEDVVICTTPTPTVTPTPTPTPQPYYSGIFSTGNTQNDACTGVSVTTLYSFNPFLTNNQWVLTQPINNAAYWAPIGIYLASGGTVSQWQYTMFAPGLVILGACPP
jgi:hypothetical protein